MPAWLISAATWLFTTNQGQQLLLGLIGLVAGKKLLDGKKVEKFLPLVREVFLLVEAFSKKQPTPLTGEQKRDIAMGRLMYLAKANGISLSSELKKQADAAWNQMGWAQKVAK